VGQIHINGEYRRRCGRARKVEGFRILPKFIRRVWSAKFLIEKEQKKYNSEEATKHIGREAVKGTSKEGKAISST